MNEIKTTGNSSLFKKQCFLNFILIDIKKIEQIIDEKINIYYKTQSNLGLLTIDSDTKRKYFLLNKLKEKKIKVECEISFIRNRTKNPEDKKTINRENMDNSSHSNIDNSQKNNKKPEKNQTPLNGKKLHELEMHLEAHEEELHGGELHKKKLESIKIANKEDNNLDKKPLPKKNTFLSNFFIFFQKIFMKDK